ncbi:chemotaxis protein CheW [Venenivibrio stagnispumantis]|uniref:Purine-binding chemotaxis protein CheW n=1 Tax=Venenivibrio stagnispumantis TaxID=407998 RepID=A0AA45WNP5_9AQUI|nr:chemotaxis protein CheW [Venenivibrio stagnispumantis]MCW4573911.1 chemotaxis protein CheW [Venenivibrio stagnispumantis]SMP18788.1 purine-binding chemotaxis protein CheW [Venenivibrio stagnispumantis]
MAEIQLKSMAEDILKEKKGKILEFLVVKLEDEIIGISLKEVLEISKLLEIFEVPLSESYIKGVINLRGEIIPVVSLKEKIGLEEKTASNRLVIVETKLGKIALLVDAVLGVTKIEEDALEQNPMTSIYSDYISNVALSNFGFMSILDLSKVFKE